MTATAQDPQLRTRMQQLDTLLQEVESFPDPASRERMARVIQGLMDFHGAAIARLLECVRETDAGRSAIDAAADDELASNLLLLYGLHPLDIEARVKQALDSARPYLRSHGGNVELLGITDGVVRLRMQGSCHGCPSSAVTLRTSIEQAIYDKAPDVAGIEVEGGTEPPPPHVDGFVPLEKLGSRNAKVRLTPDKE